jgi:hypothetical protein
MKANLFFLIVSLTLLLITDRVQAITIVRDGKAEAFIVVPQGSAATGAADLQKYVEKVSGAKLEIVTEDKLESAKHGSRIFVGPCLAASRVVDLQKLQPEGFVIKTDGNDLFIVGRDSTDTDMPVAGTFYGVCEFLERYAGVRWLMEGPLGEVTPRRATIEVAAADIRQEPALCMRGSSGKRAADHSASWSAYQRIGSRVKISAGHAYSGWWDRYHEQYPEIFAMQANGTRVNTNRDERLCESNPVLWKLVAEQKIKELRASPDLLATSISENDGGENGYCICETCRSWDSPEAQERFKTDPALFQKIGPLSDHVCRFYNSVAKLVKQEVPDRYVAGYAYSVYTSPPVVIDHLEDNLMIGYVGFDIEEYLNDAARTSERDEWVKWSKLTKHLFLRPNLLLQPIGFPVNYTHKLGEDLRFMADHGMWGATYGSGSGGSWGTQGLDYYVLAKLLWDPHRDVDAIIEDYCRSAYGPGAGAMEEYYRRTEDLTNRVAAAGTTKQYMEERKEFVNGIVYVPKSTFTDWWTDAELAKLQTCLDQAAAAIGAGDAPASERVRLVATGLEYTKKTRDLLAAAAAVRAGNRKPEEFNKIKADTDQYYESLKGSRAVRVSRDIEMALSLKSDVP